MNINLASLFLKNLLKHLKIKQKDCLVACEDVLCEEIEKLHDSLNLYVQGQKQCSNGKVSAQIKEFYRLYKISAKSNYGGITAFKLYKELNGIYQYVKKKKILSSDEYSYLKEISNSDFIDADRYSTGLDSKTLQRILTPEVSLRAKEYYFEKIEFIVTTVLPQMDLKPDLAKRLNQQLTTKKDIAEELFTYNENLVHFEGMDWVTTNLARLDESQDCAGELGKIVRKLFTVVTVVDVDDHDADSDDSNAQFVLDEAGFHMSSLYLITAHLAMFNIEIPAASQSEFNKNIYKIISNTVYPAYIDRCRNENYEPGIDSWKEGFRNDQIAAGLVLHGLHMDKQMHQSFCNRLEEIAATGRGAK